MSSKSIERQKWIDSCSKKLFLLEKREDNQTTEQCDRLAEQCWESREKFWGDKTSNMSNNQEHSESDFAKESAESSFRDIRSLYKAWVKETSKEKHLPNHLGIWAKSKKRKKRQKFLDKVAIGLLIHNVSISSSGSYEVANLLWEERERRLSRESNPVTE